MSNLVVCLACDSGLPTTNALELAEILSCTDCGQEFEVIETTPLVKVDYAPEVEEDWGE